MWMFVVEIGYLAFDIVIERVNIFLFKVKSSEDFAVSREFEHHLAVQPL